MLNRGKFLKIVSLQLVEAEHRRMNGESQLFENKIGLAQICNRNRKEWLNSFLRCIFLFGPTLHCTQQQGALKSPLSGYKHSAWVLIHITRWAVPRMSVTSMLRGIGERRIAGLPGQHPSPQTRALGTSHRMTKEDPNTILWPFYVYIYPTTRIYIHIDTQKK